MDDVPEALRNAWPGLADWERAVIGNFRRPPFGGYSSSQLSCSPQEKSLENRMLHIIQPIKRYYLSYKT